MKVAIDARMVRGRMHGIARHVVLLASGFRSLAEQGKLKIDPIFIVDESDSDAKRRLGAFRTVGAHSRFLSLKEIVDLPRILKTISPDLYHSPSFSSLVVCPCPHVVTVHDLNHLRFGSRLKRVYYRQFLKPFCKSARKVVTVSNSVASELSKWLKLKSGSVSVVSSAIDASIWSDTASKTTEAVLSKYALDSRNYFLAIYSEKPHKGLGTLIAAYSRYREKVGAQALPLALVAGPLSYTKSQGIVRIPSVDDVALSQLMAHARAFLFPSIYEGLGLPPVEAIAAGAHVVLSDIPAHRESLERLESAASWVEPDQEKDWVMALSRAAEFERFSVTEIERLNLVIRERYSAEKMAAAYQNVYLEAVR